MAVQISLFQIIFEQFLKISPDLLSKYSTVQDQLLYLILVPHIILFLFLITFSSWVTGTHKKLQILTSVGTYIFLIWGGWYGTLIVPLFIFWFYGVIFIALSVFFIGRLFLHPSKTGEFAEVAKGLHRKLTEKSEKIKALDKEIEKVDRQLKSFGYGPYQPQQQQFIDYLKSQKAALEVEREHLEK